MENVLSEIGKRSLQNESVLGAGTWSKLQENMADSISAP
jgi:hypothetical protein